MKNKLLYHWLGYSWFAAFFEGLSQWRRATECIEPLQKQWEQLLPLCEDPQLLQEYDDLFRGTRADVYVPLWASVCKYEDGNLLDKTTLAVIQEYHQWGYKPIGMEGNPPDYIGQQLRFLCYLCACALHTQAKGEDGQPFQAAIDHFTSEYLLDTVHAIAKGIQSHSRTALFLQFADVMLHFFSGEATDLLLQDLDPNQLSDLLPCFSHYQTGRAPAISDAEPITINTAGRNNCGGKCSIRATVQDGCIINLETGMDIGEPSLRACVRGRGYRKTYLNGQRLRFPMRRIGERGEGRFQRISWEEAADLIANEWTRTKMAYGPGCRYVNYGLGVHAVIRPDFLVKRLMNLDGGFLGFYGSYSFACAQYVTPFIYGDKFSGNSVEDVLNTKLLILWGHNPSETNFGSQRNYLISQDKKNGLKVIVIDPRQSDTVISVADEWIGIRPSTDGALADAMAHVIWSEGLQDQNFMDTYCIGFDEHHMPEGVSKKLIYHSYLFGELDGTEKTPEWAEAITGIPAETIRRLAREYATTKPACLMPGLGNQRIGNGEQTVRGMAMLACMTGNVGKSGGGSAGAGFVQEEATPSFPVGESGYTGVISCFLWTKAIEDGANMTSEKDNVQGMTQLESNIKLLFNLAGNALINQHADINNSIRILKDTNKCEFLVCSDVFMTPSARFADLLLPAPSFLEDDNITAPWRVGHYLLCNNKVIEPLFDCRTEYRWVSDVAKRLGLWAEWSEGRNSQAEWL